MRWKRIRFVGGSKALFYITKAFPMLFNKIGSLLGMCDYERYKQALNIENELRIEATNYTEKDTQDRTTFIVYYAQNDKCIEVKCRFYKKVREDEYVNFKQSVEIHTSMPTSDIKFEGGFCYFYIYMPFKPMYENKADRLSVSIGTYVKGLLMWEYNKYPHALIVGETGQGKSVFVRYLLSSLFSHGHEVWCVDGKCIDYFAVKNRFKRYTPNSIDKTELLALTKDFYNLMHLRYDEMAINGITTYEEIDGYMPKFLLIDEYLSVVKQMAKKEREEFEKYISDIVLLGRACGFILIVTMQRADTKYISGDMRDNFMCRIVLGSASEQSYKMMFEKTMKPLEIGQAWVSLGNRMELIGVPYLKTFDCVKE